LEQNRAIYLVYEDVWYEAAAALNNSHIVDCFFLSEPLLAELMPVCCRFY
jgi:hypothetical protein